MWMILWAIAWCFMLFSFLPTCSVRIAHTYSRWFGTNIYTDLWYKMFWVSAIVTVTLMFINLLMGE